MLHMNFGHDSIHKVQCSIERSSSNSDFEPQDVVPEFQSEWEKEYAVASFQPGRMRTVCIFMGGYFLFLFVIYMDTAIRSGSQSIPLLLMAVILCFLGCFAILILIVTLASRRLKSFFVNKRERLSSIIMIMFTITFIIPAFFLELSRSSRKSEIEGNIRIRMDRSELLPQRICSDSQPNTSLSILNDSLGGVSFVGCENIMLSGDLCFGYLLLNLLPVTFKVGYVFAIFCSLINTTTITIMMLSSGAKLVGLLALVALELMIGMIAAIACKRQRMISRNYFALAKGMRLATQQNRHLLYSLIPRNVVEHLRSHSIDDGMPAIDIPDCTVMFCSLEPHELLRSSFSAEVFDLINDVFSEFDAAVQRSGMFKYQHVGEWYIVACPRAARAFDRAEQAAPYPSEYTVSMALLADELQAIARRYTDSESRPLWLRVGINRGPIAGAVIGRHRAFYTLYGDTINTAARMCKYAGTAVHCTAPFRDAVEAAGAEILRCESLGEREVKGKGRMETFDLFVNSTVAARAARMPTPQKLSARRHAALDSGSRAFAIRPGGGSCNSADSDMERVREALRRPSDAVAALPIGLRDGFCRFRAVLADEGLERRFRRSAEPADAGRLAAALVLRLAAVACQWDMVASPEYDYDFAALGDPGLEQAKAAVRGVLTAHFAAAAALTLLGLGLCAAHRNRWAQAVFVTTKAIHLAVSVALVRRLPGRWGWLIVFSSQLACLDGMLGAMPFLSTLALNAAAFATLTAVIVTLPVLAASAVARQVTSTLLLGVGSGLIARAADLGERRRWLLGFRYQAELRKLRRMLFDLLPAKIARRMLEAGGRIPCEPCVAVVLQLDICRFTELSQEMAPMEVARMLHAVFSAFDAAVLERGLFKMDTIGDAYIAAGFLPPEDPSSPPGARAAEVQAVCAGVLGAAEAMLRAAAAYRANGGRDVHCRIGISLGTVIAGVLGRLQPRLHLFGQGMRAAESHEQEGEVDAVHVNHAFMTALGRRAASPGAASNIGGEGEEGNGSPGAARLAGWGVSESPTVTMFGFGGTGRVGRWPRRASFVLTPEADSNSPPLEGEDFLGVAAQSTPMPDVAAGTEEKAAVEAAAAAATATEAWATAAFEPGWLPGSAESDPPGPAGIASPVAALAATAVLTHSPPWHVPPTGPGAPGQGASTAPPLALAVLTPLLAAPLEWMRDDFQHGQMTPAQRNSS